VFKPTGLFNCRQRKSAHGFFARLDEYFARLSVKILYARLLSRDDSTSWAAQSILKYVGRPALTHRSIIITSYTYEVGQPLSSFGCVNKSKLVLNFQVTKSLDFL